MDIPLHDTYFVVAHFHIVMGVSAFFGMIAGVYHWFPKMFEGKMMNKKNTFSDFISCAKFLIQKKYTSRKKIIAYGGSAGGLLVCLLYTSPSPRD